MRCSALDASGSLLRGSLRLRCRAARAAAAAVALGGAGASAGVVLRDRGAGGVLFSALGCPLGGAFRPCE